MALSFTLEADGRLPSGETLAEATELDDGDPQDLAGRYLGLREVLPALRVIGGCCGTDERHVSAMSKVFATNGQRLFAPTATCA